MPDLFHSLQNHDLGHLRIVAELWGLELNAADSDAAQEKLSASLPNPELVTEITDVLPSGARTALTALVQAGGRLPWATFVRKYGNVREMGAGKRDREKPYLKPTSAAEILYYRALLARAFFDTEKGPQEFAYVPDDLLPLLHREANQESVEGRSLSISAEPLGRDATPGEKAYVIRATDRILDNATTLLAALRLGREVHPDPKLTALLHASKLLKQNVPQAEKVKSFLEAPRAEALDSLIEIWQTSETFNELRLIPDLICEGEWKNQPAVTREFLLNLLGDIPEGKWWSLTAFVRAFKGKYPDFQRPAGDYDSWFIKRVSDGEYLRGFEAWDQVDGALVRFFVIDVLHWLGIVDLAAPGDGREVTAFRAANPASRLSSDENAKVHLSSNGKIMVPRLTPRAVRYQVSRFCEWDQERPDEYHYHVTPKSLAKAKQQRLKVEQLLTLLARYSDAGIPPVLVKAIKRWEVSGVEARAETLTVLRVSRPEILGELRKSRAARFLGDSLGPTTVVIKAGAQSKVLTVLAEMGFLTDSTNNFTDTR